MSSIIESHCRRMKPERLEAYAPQPAPTTEMLFSSSRLTLTVGMSPAVKPTTARRPSSPRERSESVNRSPPTGSTTTSTPAPPVISFAASLNPSTSTAWSAPADRATSPLPSEDTTAITVAPRALANWMQATPTPPAAPCTSTVSPSARRQRVSSTKCAVR